MIDILKMMVTLLYFPILVVVAYSFIAFIDTYFNIKELKVEQKKANAWKLQEKEKRYGNKCQICKKEITKSIERYKGISKMSITVESRVGEYPILIEHICNNCANELGKTLDRIKII